MNTQFQLKFLNALNAKKADQGFTLIELLVCVIIIGVLAAIALPNLLGQVAKGRQAECKNNLGAINRAQQTYRLEEQVFGKVADLPVKFSWQYYTLADAAGTNDSYQSYSCGATTQYSDDILNYAAAVYQVSGTFNSVIVEENGLNTNALSVNATATDAGAAGGKKVVK